MAMQAYGVATVIDLRSPGEVSRDPVPRSRDKGVRYVHAPLIDDANMNNIGDAGNMLERYLMIVEKRHEAFRDVFQRVAEAEGGVLFHCFAGKDRTGLVAAMLLELADVPREHIAEDYAETDRQLARQYEVWINEAEPEKRDAFRDELRCPPERILGVLDHMQQRWGGVHGYLGASGMTPADIERLSTKLA